MLNDENRLITPRKYGGLITWYDASQITGKNDGDVISQWNDLSGNNYHLLQSTNDYRPLYKLNSQNGLPGIYFNGYNKHLAVNFGTTFAQPLTILCVAKVDDFNDPSKSGMVYDGIDYQRIALGANSSRPYAISYYAGTPAAMMGTSSYYKSSCALYNTLFNTSSSYARINSHVTTINISPGTNSLNGLNIGKASDSETRSPVMRMYEFIMYNKALNELELYYIENYLNKKWGLYPRTNKVKDSMTRANNNSSMGNCDSNQVWSAGSYSTTPLPTIGISSNYGYFPSTTGTDSHAWVESGVSDGVITCNIKYDADSDKGILFRRVDANNYFYAHIDSTNDTLKISRCLGGVRSDIASVSDATTSPGDQKNWIVILSGSSITVFTGQGNKTATATDSNLVTATKHGLYSASGNTTAFRYFSVEV